MIWKIFLTVIAAFFIAFLLIIGRAFTRDLEDHVTGETSVDEEGRIIGYSIYGLAILIFVLTFLYLQ
jgi:lipopolysaccharide export LptBFGC system permease protein LptF